MDWSKAKIIFIITFLLLNIFLGYQLNEKRIASKVSLLLEATLQERLSEMNITINGDLLDEEPTGTYISGSVEIELDKLIKEKKPSQEVASVTNEFVRVELLEPYPINLIDKSREAQVNEFVLQHVINGNEYRFSHYDERLMQFYFYQTYKGKKIDNYESGRLPLRLKLDDNQQIIEYEQNYLTIRPIQPQEEEQEMLSSIKAIEKLFNRQLIPPDSKITKVELSYYSFFKPLGEVQVFAPMWSIGVNEHIYYVNAVDGAVQNIQ